MHTMFRISRAILLIAICLLGVAQAASIQEARSQYHSGKLKQALAQTNTLLQENANNISALFLKAQIQSERLQSSEAIKTYKSIITLQPTHLQAYNNLAALYAQQGKLKQASETLEQAIRTDPVFTTIHTNLRAIYMEMSQKHYRQALKLKDSGSATQIAAIDIDNSTTDQILDQELEVVPSTIQGAVNTNVPVAAVMKKPEPPILVANNDTSKKESKAPASSTIAPGSKKPAAKPVVKKEARPAPGQVAKAPVEKKPKAEVVNTEVIKTAPAPVEPSVEVEKALLSWANAWSNRDIDRYVAAYLPSYTTSGKSHKDWAAGRNWNFKKKQYIKVTLSDIKIQRKGDRYNVRFKQRYQSDNYKDVVNKELLFVKHAGKWKISKEAGS